MPWKGIAKWTLVAAATTAAALTAVCADGLRQARKEAADASAFRWTDKNRWE